MLVREICDRCNGSGEGMYDGSTCGYCHGTGEILVCDTCGAEYKNESNISANANECCQIEDEE